MYMAAGPASIHPRAFDLSDNGTYSPRSAVVIGNIVFAASPPRE